MIDIARAPGLLTVQDTGRPGHRADGVPLSGVMDCVTTATLNCMLGNARSAAVLELALGEATLEFDDNVEFAFGGAGARSTLNDERLNDYT
ncbi:MAG: allophanate hydrolase subunit 2 family protein, partial [Gemmatimonadota bacterium]|nr:allophanate hydrolase subunit 2 family protein [Gemmatimonadota bacterium]